MLKDDRMMSMLTFVVIMIAVGAMVQRADIFERFFGGSEAALVLERDEVIVKANTLSPIDVLANDRGLKEGDDRKLIIVKQPECGKVFVRDRKAQYLPAIRCVGSQVFEYALSGRGYVDNGEVVVAVRLSEPTQEEVAANAQRDVEAPAPVASNTQENVTAETPSLLPTQPGATTAGNSAALATPAIPLPQTTTVTGLPDTVPGDIPGAGPAVAGLGLRGAGPAPSLIAPSDTLGAIPQNISVPVIPPPGPELPLQPNLEIGIDDGTDDQTGATIGLARVDPAYLEPAQADGATGLGLPRENDGLDTGVLPAQPQEITSGGARQPGLGDPAGALASIRDLGDAANLTPVDTTPPAVLPDPNVMTGAGTPQSQAQQPGNAADQVAALTSPTITCTEQPALILEIKSAGLTKVIIDSPCYANTVAELSYNNLRLGVAIDSEGSGIVAAVGLQQASDAVLRFVDGEVLNFNIPFSDTERMERVALVWKSAVDLDLNAFEFGAQPQSAGHVRPDQPRSYGEVRRRGGGYLIEYRPVSGVGDFVSVYTYWRRRAGGAGVVKLKVEFASRIGPQRPETCGEGFFAAPEFTVLRSAGGKLERPRHRRLAALDCAAVAGTAQRYIKDAIDDMVVLQR